MRVRLKPEVRQAIKPASQLVPIDPPPVHRVRLKKPRIKGQYGVMLYGGSFDRMKDGTLKFDAKSPEIEGYHLTGYRLFAVKRVGRTHTQIIDTGEFDQPVFQVENDMWRRLVEKGRVL